MSSIINSIEALSETQKKTSNITKDKYKPITRNPSKSKFLQSNDIYYSSNQLTSRNTNNKISKHNSSHSKNNLFLIKNFDYVSRNKNKNNSNHVPLSCPRNYSSYRDETQNNNDTIYTSVNTINKNNGPDYKKIVNDIIIMLNNKIGLNVEPHNLSKEINTIIEDNRNLEEENEKKKYINVKDYNDSKIFKQYCMDLMKSNKLGSFEELQMYINELTEQRRMHNKYLKNLRKMLNENPDDLIQRKNMQNFY